MSTCVVSHDVLGHMV